VKGHDVLRLAAKLLLPFILIFGLYVQFHGDFGPGGGFQAGVIVAAGLIVVGLIFGPQAVRRIVSPASLERLVALGVLIYAGTGFAALLGGGRYLEYGVLSHDPQHGQHLGIMLVELGVGLTVTSAMLLIFLAFAGAGDEA